LSLRVNENVVVAGDDCILLVDPDAAQESSALERLEYSSCSMSCVGTISPTREEWIPGRRVFLRQVQSGNDSEAGG
jgi:hypothetical protein